MSIQTSLQQLGLSDRESKIYIALLELLEASVSTIAQKVDLPRSTTYKDLHSLEKQGLVSSIKKNKVQYFTPTSPRVLLQLVERKREIVESVLPELNALIDTSGQKPSLKLYEGVEGMKIILEENLELIKENKVKHLYAMSHPEILDFLPRYFPKWVERRIQAGAYTYLIVPESEKKREEYYKGGNRETRFLPERFPFRCSMDIIGNRVTFMTVKDKNVYSFILESEVVSNMFMQLFKFTWEMLESDSK